MIRELNTLQYSVFIKLELKISNLHPDSECEEYLGHNFQLNQSNIKFRKAKITPKKIGQFVTLWKRNPERKQTEPFHIEDNFDFYIIMAEFTDRAGFFFFPKDQLAQRKILSTLQKEGKRGFRVYPDWNIPENNQAKKTKEWQEKFFIDFSEDHHLEKFERIFYLKA